MRKKGSVDFEALVGRIQETSRALQEDALVVINRGVTARAWLTGYYIVEYEQHGADRAKYGEGLLKKLAVRLDNANFALPSLKNYRAFYRTYPEMGAQIVAYLLDRFGKGYTVCSFLYADAAQLGVYMAYYRKHMMQPDDNPPVGILLCTEVGQETLEYVNTFIDPKLFVSKFQLHLPSKDDVTTFLQRENKGISAMVNAKDKKSMMRGKATRGEAEARKWH